MKILVLHKRGDSSKFKSELFKAWPMLKKYDNMFKVYLYSVTKKPRKQMLTKKYDRVYIDEETVKIEEVADTLPLIGNPQVMLFNLTNRFEKAKKAKKNRNLISSKIIEVNNGREKEEK